MVNNLPTTNNKSLILKSDFFIHIQTILNRDFKTVNEIYLLFIFRKDPQLVS